MIKSKVLLPALALAVLGLAGRAVRPGQAGFQVPFGQEGLVSRITIKADAGWVDTGIEVLQGDPWSFRATGRITLQRGNPAAECGPDGLDFMTVQQPVPDRNIGALVGKVAQLISVRIDEETGEEIRDEIVSLFPIGTENDVLMPIRGRLYLGVNENVYLDNGGEFVVTFFRLRSAPAAGRN